MMRANLLPRSRETSVIFGVALDRDDLRAGLLGMALVLAVAALGYGIEQVRLQRLTSLALRSEAQFAERATQRAQWKQLALEVARYQEFEREAQTFRHSGSDAALAIVRIGNSVPQRVWLDSMSHEAHGYRLRGRSESVDSLGAAILALGKALPNMTSSLIDIDNRSAAGGGTQFSAKLASPESIAPDAALAPQAPGAPK